METDDSLPTFRPYKGLGHLKSSPKLLVLGESHYCKQDECCFQNSMKSKCSSFTEDVLKDYLNYKKGINKHSHWMNTFTKFSNVVSGKKQSKLESVKFWENVAFYNFVQVPMNKSRQSPTIEDFNNSYTAFRKVLETVNPDIILVWGFRLGDNIPKEDFKGKRDFLANTFNYFELKKKYPLLVLPHPSSSKLSYGHKKTIDFFIKKSVKDFT